VRLGCGAGASALRAATIFLHLFFLESHPHALSAAHDASSLWAAQPVLWQPMRDNVTAIIIKSCLMIPLLLGQSAEAEYETEHHHCDGDSRE
jgi:hypothetical protein